MGAQTSLREPYQSTSKGQPWWCAPVRHFRNGLKHYSRGGKPGRCLQKKRASTRRFVTWTRR